ncbi:hypothetical protein ABEG18_19185 [Alsobacter sp. KACC 23698]|uniref:DUF4404 family protein n=1 Tax=Alsobacter sp. KACC 23698 TaxID=3149229 RepID=A0AAU7JC25_9HYPH
MSEIPKIDALLAELRQVAEGQGGEQARLQEMMARVDAFERELLNNSYEESDVDRVKAAMAEVRDRVESFGAELVGHSRGSLVFERLVNELRRRA